MSLRVLCMNLYNDRPQSETFIGLKKAGIHVEVVTRSASPHNGRLSDAGIPVIPMQIRSRFDLPAIRRVRSLIRDRDFDILHLFDNRSISNGIMASAGLPVKVITYRGVIGNLSLFDPVSWLTHLNPRVDRVVCNSRAVSQFFLNMKIAGYRLPPRKFITIYKGHDPAWYETPPADLSEFAIPEDAFTVCCVANYRVNKGTHLLLEAAEWLPEDQNIHFLLVGEIENKNFLRKISQSPRRERFHLAGYRHDVPALMSACDTLVQPTLWRESFPRSVVEGMSLGLPPIVSGVGGNPELVEDNVSGLVFQQGNPRELAEKILEMKGDAERRRGMGQEARKRIETRFNVEMTVEKTLKLYLELASE